MSLNNKGLLFSHIPKTAGTSFRKSINGFSLLGFFFGWKACFDYGSENKATSEFIRALYKSADFSRLSEISDRKILLAGHFLVQKYLKYYRIDRVLTFVREPAQRIASHYHDLQKRINYAGTLQDFVREPQYQNIQSRYLRGVPVEAIGLVCICEHYKDSIELVEKVYGMKVGERRLNQNRQKGNSLYTIDDEVLAEIRRLNAADYELYNRAMNLFLTRRKLITEGRPYVYGKAEPVRENRVQGWAVNPNASRPVHLDVILNDRPVAQIHADQPMPKLQEINIARNGEVGFSHTFSEPLAATDKVEIRVTGTNQLL